MIVVLESVRGLVLLQGTSETFKQGRNIPDAHLEWSSSSHSKREAVLAKTGCRRPLLKPMVVKDKNNGEFKR